jgi:hypothetical protein
MNQYSWSEDACGLPGDPTVMNAYFSTHPEIKKFRYKRIGFYDDIEELLDGIAANGDAAVNISEAISSTQTLKVVRGRSTISNSVQLACRPLLPPLFFSLTIYASSAS